MATRDDDEARLYSVVSSGLQRWLTRASAAVLAPWKRHHLPPDPSAIHAAEPTWRAEVETILTTVGQIAMGAWSRATNVPPVSRHAFVMATLAHTRNLLVGIPEEIYHRVFAELIDGTNAGEDVDKLAARVNAVLDWSGHENWPARAHTIAVTECLPPDAVVDSANIIAAYRRWYEGDFVTVMTEQGHKFSGTPNHPVLTQRGWVGLGSLAQNDQLVCNKRTVQISAVTGNPDVEARPVEIAKLFDSLQAVGIGGRIAGREPDFHGDGRDGNVDVSLSDCELRLNGFEPLTKDDLQVALKGADPTLILLSCERAALAERLLVSTSSGTRRVTPSHSGQAQDSRNRVSRTVKLVGDLLAAEFFLNVEMRDQGRIETVAGGGSLLESSLDGCLLCGGSVASNARTVDHSVDSVNPESEPAGDGIGASSSCVFLDHVVSVSVEYRATHVYNLSTTDGYFLSGGVYTGNTTRAYGAGTLAAGMEQSR